MFQRTILVLLAFALTLVVQDAFASHVRAADVRVERICGTLTFRITITAYLNSESSTPFGRNSFLYFGDGSELNLPIINSVLRPGLGEDISVATFTTTHTYSANSTYKIAYVENHRNDGILNIDDSGDVAYVTFVEINTGSTFGCNNFPVLSVVPLDQGCRGVTFFHSSGAYDIDGDSLSYALTTPASSQTAFASYTAPNAQEFYMNYNSGNEEGNGPPVFSINSLTGLVTWDAPGLLGEYNIAFQIIEWRKQVDGSYVKLSTTTRDMQIVVTDCDNIRPDLIIPNDTCVVAGATVKGFIFGNDEENHPVKIEVFSELSTIAPNAATYSPHHTNFVSSNPPAQITFDWLTDCANVRQQPYQVVFKITDDPPDGPKLSTYKTWSIRVVAPAPEFESVTLDVVNHYGIISVKDYACDNVTGFEVWRKVDSYPYTPGYCETGIPRNSGYQLIDVIPGTSANYIDTNFGNGLSPGAKYCYRLVALVADSKSYVSEEACIGPVKADAPVITHVSVERTSVDSGSIRVSWRSPSDIDKTQFPEPYEYEIYRATGFIGDTSLVKVAYVSDTTALDTSLNTHESIFNYRIVIYSKPALSSVFIPVDTSAIASTVRLSGTATENGTILHWRDSVPWSNVVYERPYHLILRGEGMNVNEESMTIIDSVNVISNDFEYLDTEATSNNFYSYKVVTRGTYGNPAIPLQENRSQLIAIYPDNDFVPCAPLVTVDQVDCTQYTNSYTCQQTSFTNIVRWEGADDSDQCRQDIVAYKLYVSSSTEDEFMLLATLSGTEYIDADLASMAKCYRVSAVDSRGIEGPLSEMACKDNCPYFELPNVFTPNADNCNELFTANYDRGNEQEGGCGSVDKNKCPRFVLSVDCKIYNRWGKEVYHSSSNDSGSLYIDWNGRNQDGMECSTGVYYYSADVVFDVINPAARKQTFKGWVHLLR